MTTSVVEALERDLAGMPEDVAESTLAAAAMALARELDGDNSATSKSMCARALRETMDALYAAAPEDEGKDRLDDLAARRAARLEGRTAP